MFIYTLLIDLSRKIVSTVEIASIPVPKSDSHFRLHPIEPERIASAGIRGTLFSKQRNETLNP
jgi:hypothetical protein